MLTRLMTGAQNNVPTPVETGKPQMVRLSTPCHDLEHLYGHMMAASMIGPEPESPLT